MQTSALLAGALLLAARAAHAGPSCTSYEICNRHITGDLIVDGTLTAVTGLGLASPYTYPATGAVPRAVSGKLGDSVSICDFGQPCPNGVDDTPAAQACVNAGLGGPIVCEFPPALNGYKLVSVLTLAKKSTLRIRGNTTVTTAGIRLPDSATDITGQSEIECPEHATIKLANAANVDLIANTTFATLTGSGNQFGTFRFSLRGCQLDGNKTNQAALVSTTTGTITNVARSAGGVVTITMSGATTPPVAAGMTVNIDGLTNDNFSFNGRFVVQSGGNPFTYNQTLRNTVASTAATGAGTVKGYSGSNGVRVFGRNMRFEDLSIANNVLDGLWTEGYTPSAFTDDTTELEATVRSLRLVNSGGDGWVYWGPQVTHAWDVVDFTHGQWGREVFQAIFDAHTIGYLNGSGSLHIGSGGSIQQSGSQETSAAGWGILVDSGTGPSSFAADLVGCLGCIGIEFRSPGHAYQGVIQNNTTGVKFNGGGAILNVGMASNTTWFDCTSENGNVILDVYSNDNSGTMKGPSCWIGTEWLRLPALGGNTTRFQQPGSLSGFFIGGWNPVFPASNSTLVVPDLSTTFTAAQRMTSTTNAGTITLAAGTGTATVASGAKCVCTDTTANTSVRCAVASTTLTATGTGTDVIVYLCL